MLSEYERRTAAVLREDKRFKPHLAAFTLSDADDMRGIEPQVLKHFSRHLDLTASAVNQHHGREHRFAPGHGEVAPRHHFLHGRVVVPCFHVIDIESPVLRAIHFEIPEDDAGRDRCFA